MFKFLYNLNFDFMGNRRIAYLISGTLVALGLVGILLRLTPLAGLVGLKQTWSIDFTGGRLVQVYVEAPIERVRGAILGAGINAEIQNIGEANKFLIKYSGNVEADSVVKILENKLGKKVRLDRSDIVGPRIGSELRERAILLSILGLILILIYIWFRFDLVFGLAATLALFHDAIISWGIYSLLGFETDMTVIAAVLTLIGYSINDSIVIADRVREYLGRFKLMEFSAEELIKIFNSAINSTLSRTVITAFTALIVVLAILFFGGPVLFNFAFVMTVGIIVGTYSSIFIVAALVLDWRLRREK
ncbi:MAG: protein translocase subunit SecF [candidate division WOR-3 bacterium]